MRSKKRERFKKAMEVISQNEDKYFDIVWWTRKNEKELLIEQRYDVLASCQKVKEKYPEEVKKIKECPDNWQHGFNSGMLACLRLVSMMIEQDVDWALEEFPFLDT